MRILVISNLYPPYHIGGYELGCADVVQGLRRRGHDVRVLTSTYGVRKPQHADGVYRWLQLDWEMRPRVGAAIRREFCDRLCLVRLLAHFCPQIVYVWNATGLSLWLSVIATKIGIPAAFFVSDSWVEISERIDLWTNCRDKPSHQRWRTMAKKVLCHLDPVRGPLQFPNAHFASRYLHAAALKAGRSVQNSTVIHWGVDLSKFSFCAGRRPPGSILYVGQVVPHKGVHTAIAALGMLTRRGVSLSLDIVGEGVNSAYMQRLRHQVSTGGLEGRVKFAGRVPRESLPESYQKHGLLVFPSEWQEPFAITLLESMACGLPVVASATGGTPEAISHELNGLLFEAGDAESCATQILRLITDGELYDRLRMNARAAVEERFGLERMLDEIEAGLRAAIVGKALDGRNLSLPMRDKEQVDPGCLNGCQLR